MLGTILIWLSAREPSQFNNYTPESFKTFFNIKNKAAIPYSLTTMKISYKNIKHKVLNVYVGITH